MLRPRLVFTVSKRVRAAIVVSGSPAPKPSLNDAYSSQTVPISSHLPSPEPCSPANSSQPLSHLLSQRQLRNASTNQHGAGDPPSEASRIATGWPYAVDCASDSGPWEAAAIPAPSAAAAAAAAAASSALAVGAFVFPAAIRTLAAASAPYLHIPHAPPPASIHSRGFARRAERGRPLAAAGAAAADRVTPAAAPLPPRVPAHAPRPAAAGAAAAGAAAAKAEERYLEENNRERRPWPERVRNAVPGVAHGARAGRWGERRGGGGRGEGRAESEGHAAAPAAARAAGRRGRDEAKRERDSRVVTFLLHMLRSLQPSPPSAPPLPLTAASSPAITVPSSPAAPPSRPLASPLVPHAIPFPFLASHPPASHPPASPTSARPVPPTVPLPSSPPPAIPPTQRMASGGRMGMEEMLARLQQQWQMQVAGSSSGRNRKRKSKGRITGTGESSKEGEEGSVGGIQDNIHTRGAAKVRSYHVSEVLKTLWDADVGLAFFRWAKDVQGVQPDAHVYSSLFGLLGRGKDATSLERVVEEMREDGCGHNAYTLQALAAVYARAGRSEEALATLAEVEHWGFSDDRSTVGARVDVLFRMGRYRDVVKTFNVMREAGHTPDTFIYNAAVMSYGRLNNTVGAEMAFKEMITKGMALTVRSANSLMEVYGNAGRIDDAMAVFDRMCLAACTNAAAAAVPASTASAAPRTTSTSTAPSSSPPSIWPAPDMITYTVAVHLLSNAGRLSEAEATFDAMLVAGMQPDAVAWSTMVLMWAREGNPQRAAMWFKRMVLAGCPANASAYNALLLAFVSVGMFEEAEEVLSAFKNGWDLVGQVDLSGEKHTGFGKRRPDQASGPTDGSMEGDTSLWAGQAVNLVRGKVLKVPVGEGPNLMTYTMLLNACTTSTARSDVGRLVRLMEATEHPAHAVFHLLLEGFDAPQKVPHLPVEAAGTERGSEGGSKEGSYGETGRDAVARVVERGLVEVEVRRVLGEWEEERWREVERAMRGAVCTKADIKTQHAFSEACVAFLHKFGRHEGAARMWDLCHTRLQLFPNIIRLPAVYGRHGKCLLDLHGISAGTAVTVTKWALEKMRQAVAASAVSGAADASLEATSVTPEHGQSLVLEAADSVDSDDADEGAMLAAHESTELSPGVGAATASNDSPLEWRRPLKVEIVTGWGKRSRVQGASLVKAGVEAVLLRELRAPFSVHRFHPGSYEADGADLEAWLLTPGVDQVLAPRDSG